MAGHEPPSDRREVEAVPFLPRGRVMQHHVEYSFVIPTYKRPDTLRLALESIASLDGRDRGVEVIVVDNGEAANTSYIAKEFESVLPLRYVVNERNGGPAYSINRGLRLSRGRRIVIMNDDALLPASFLQACDRTFALDPRVGCVGVRPIEDGYCREGEGIGRIDRSGAVVGNFDLDPGGVIDVEHVYGFCYVISRDAFDRTGPIDEVLLATPKCNGDRNETDHCLTIRRAGFRVLFNPGIAVRHLAKPRTDMSERSPRWRLNNHRNTLYMLLKHFGPGGRQGAALRYALLHDIGILSMLRRPTRANISYVLNGLSARISACFHYGKYLLRRRSGAYDGGR